MPRSSRLSDAAQVLYPYDWILVYVLVVSHNVGEEEHSGSLVSLVIVTMAQVEAEPSPTGIPDTSKL